MAYNVLYVTNMKKSIEFYTKVYGFELREGNAEQPWAALHTGSCFSLIIPSSPITRRPHIVHHSLLGNTALALHAVESKKKAAASSKDARPGTLVFPDAKNLICSQPGQAGPGFFVPDIESFHKRALENGAVCLEEPKKEPWGGVKVIRAALFFFYYLRIFAC